jgi:hypothetical protein
MRNNGSRLTSLQLHSMDFSSVGIILSLLLSKTIRGKKIKNGGKRK